MSWGHFPFVVLSFLSLVELLRDMISNLDNAFQTGNYPIIISTAKRILFDKIAFVVYITTLLIHIIPGYAYLASIKTRLFYTLSITHCDKRPKLAICPSVSYSLFLRLCFCVRCYCQLPTLSSHLYQLFFAVVVPRGHWAAECSEVVKSCLTCPEIDWLSRVQESPMMARWAPRAPSE